MDNHTVEITLVANNGLLISGLPHYVGIVKTLICEHLSDVGLKYVNYNKEQLFSLVMEAFGKDWTLVFDFDPKAELLLDNLGAAKIYVVDNAVPPAIAVSLVDFVMHTGGLAGAEQYVTDEDGNVVGINVIGEGIPPALAVVSSARSEMDRAMYDDLIAEAEKIMRSGA